MKFLKKIRVVLSLLFFLPILLFFIDFSGKLPTQLHQLLCIQWIPALLSVNLIILGILLLFSLFFGRIYCSTICPLGVFQDILSRITRIFRKKKKYRFDYAKPQNILRYSILAIIAIVFIFGSSFLVTLLDPYSTFGRVISQLFRPLVLFANNGLSVILSKIGIYSVYEVKQVAFIPVTFSISLLFFLAILIMSLNMGRLYCNTICPVGSGLGLLSRISFFRIKIEESKCTSCRLCEKQCKAQCIDTKNMKVDDSRCVTCFNCLSACKNNGIKYELRFKKRLNIQLKIKQIIVEEHFY
jgi:polyferredoxin